MIFNMLLIKCSLYNGRLFFALSMYPPIFFYICFYLHCFSSCSYSTQIIYMMWSLRVSHDLFVVKILTVLVRKTQETLIENLYFQTNISICGSCQSYSSHQQIQKLKNCDCVSFRILNWYGFIKF